MKAVFAAALLPAAVLCNDLPAPPGIVIHHSPAASGLYMGSPSLGVAPDGSYLASHDFFGPKSGEHRRSTGRLYRSEDRGRSWTHVTDFDGYFWTGIFVHRGHVHTLGTDKHHGALVLRRSSDNGETWTGPITLAEGEWHTAPMPVIEHNGRIWRTIEDAHSSDKWGERYRARMISAPVDADLTDPSAWTISTALARDPAWLDGRFKAWLEGNAVVSPDGRIVNILRVEVPELPEKAAVVEISPDGATASFNPRSGFIDFPGAAKKFVIRKDPVGPGYWALTNLIPDRHAGQSNPASIRNTLALAFSSDLRTWETRSILLYHPDIHHHAFQYPDWQFDGDDLIAVIRTAFDDGQDGARRAHDANFLTFHRWKNFRALTREDDVPMLEYTPPS